MTDPTGAGRALTWGRSSTPEIEADIRAELEAHLELATSDYLAAGMDPEAARQAAEERFGNFENVFGACRTERLKERIMLQRTLLVLVFVLTIAVVAQAYQVHASRAESARVMDQMHDEIAQMARRIEQRFDAALLAGVSEKNERPDPVATPPRQEPLQVAEPRGLEDPEVGWREAVRTRWMETLSDLRHEQTQYKPTHSRWRTLQQDIDELEARLGDPDPDPALREAEYPSAFDVAARKRIDALSARLRDLDLDAGTRFEALDELRSLALSTGGDPERPLSCGDVVAIDCFVLAPELLSVEVNAEGNLHIPEMGFVPAVGLTPSEIELVLQERAAAYWEVVELTVSKRLWAFQALIDALADPDLFVRMAAARALGELRDARAAVALERVAADDGEEAAVRAAARQALEEIR